jgi:hypothetical protein
MITPALAQTPDQSPQNTQSSGLQQAQHMVPAQASLTHALDSNSIHTGDQFRATLNGNVHLDSGVTLHRGDALLGNVADDDTNTAGKSHLAVRFTEAVLKNGQKIPVKATIVALYTPGNFTSDDDIQPDHTPNSWNDGTLSIDQEGVMKDVDLHSQIASQNSGVFVSTRKSDVKIPAGSEIALAIAALPANSTTSGL